MVEKIREKNFDLNFVRIRKGHRFLSKLPKISKIELFVDNRSNFWSTSSTCFCSNFMGEGRGGEKFLKKWYFKMSKKAYKLSNLCLSSIIIFQPSNQTINNFENLISPGRISLKSKPLQQRTNSPSPPPSSSLTSWKIAANCVKVRRARRCGQNRRSNWDSFAGYKYTKKKLW